MTCCIYSATTDVLAKSVFPKIKSLLLRYFKITNNTFLDITVKYFTNILFEHS